MKAFLIYITDPELKSLGLVWAKKIAVNLIASGQMRENARREAALGDSSGSINVPTPRWVSAKVMQVELPDGEATHPQREQHG